MRDDHIVERVALSIATVCALVAGARAEPRDRAAQLFEEGRELLKVHDYAAACPRFAASLELRPAAGTKLNLADCEEHLGHLAAAWHLFREVVTDDGGTPERTKAARDHAAALVPRLATVRLAVRTPDRPGLVIRIGGRTVAPAREVRDRVDPGRIDIVATAPDWKGFATTATAIAGETIELAIDEPPESEPVAAPTPPQIEVATSSERRRSWVHGAWVFGGLAAAAALGGGAVTLAARSEYQGAIDRGECLMGSAGLACTPTGTRHVHHAETSADVGTGLAITAGVLGATALIAWYLAPRDRVVVAPLVGQAMAGISAAWSF